MIARDDPTKEAYWLGELTSFGKLLTSFPRTDDLSFIEDDPIELSGGQHEANIEKFAIAAYVDLEEETN